jgi:hypothetical protein
MHCRRDRPGARGRGYMSADPSELSLIQAEAEGNPLNSAKGVHKTRCAALGNARNPAQRGNPR